jgi:hypothetical protein
MAGPEQDRQEKKQANRPPGTQLSASAICDLHIWSLQYHTFTQRGRAALGRNQNLRKKTRFEEVVVVQSVTFAGSQRQIQGIFDSI